MSINELEEIIRILVTLCFYREEITLAIYERYLVLIKDIDKAFSSIDRDRMETARLIKEIFKLSAIKLAEVFKDIYSIQEIYTTLKELFSSLSWDNIVDLLLEIGYTAKQIAEIIR